MERQPKIKHSEFEDGVEITDDGFLALRANEVSQMRQSIERNSRRFSIIKLAAGAAALFSAGLAAERFTHRPAH